MLIHHGGKGPHRRSLLELLRMGQPVPFSLPPAIPAANAAAAASAAASNAAEIDSEGDPQETDRNLGLFYELLRRCNSVSSSSSNSNNSSSKSSSRGAEEGWRIPGPPWGPQPPGTNWPDLLLAKAGALPRFCGQRAAIPAAVAAAAAAAAEKKATTQQLQRMQGPAPGV